MEGLRPEDPQRVGRYRLLKRLGAGGMGQVYLGQSPSGRPVAVKVIRAELADSTDFRQRFRQEVQAARQVSGMFTAAVIDADPDAPRPWMVTAFVSGPSLADAVASRGPLSVGAVRILAAGLAEGLSEVHAAGLVHRDLKPSNVLLASDGPRIIDFGISRSADSAGPTRTGGVIGSPGFMSPEQAMGDPVGPASDVFCLGSVLAYAATGEPPFGAGPPSALLYRVVYGEASTVNIPRELRPLIANCLVRDPVARPTTDELLAELGDSAPAEGWLAWQDSGDVPGARTPSTAPSEAWRGAARETGRPDDAGLAPPAAIAPGAVLAAVLAASVLADLPADPVLAGAPADAGLADAGATAHIRSGPRATRPPQPDRPPGQRSAGELARAADTVLAHVAGHAPKPTCPAARRPATTGPRHRRPERRGKRPALAAACVLGVVIAGTLALSRLEPSQPAAGQATTEGAGAFGHPDRPGRQHRVALGHGQAAQAAGTGAPALASNGASAAPGPGEVEPTTVVLNFFAAVDHGNWAAAWALGGDNLYPNRAALVAGYADATGQNVSVVSASGDTVVARVQTTNSWGFPAVHTQQFVVQNGAIVARRSAGFR